MIGVKCFVHTVIEKKPITTVFWYVSIFFESFCFLLKECLFEEQN